MATYLIVIVLVALAWWSTRTPLRPAVVEDVLDGDSLVVRMDGRRVTVRLFGIDCPEKGQPYSQAARSLTRGLALDRPVSVRVMDTDRYGRQVGVVGLPDGRTLNHELVSSGLAWWYRYHAPDDSDLASREKAAREAGLGLWQDPDPTPPWEFRRKNDD